MGHEEKEPDLSKSRRLSLRKRKSLARSLTSRLGHEETSRLPPSRTPATGVVLFESCERDVPNNEIPSNAIRRDDHIRRAVAV